MARPSPATQRIIATLNFFADNSGQAFSLTDLIRALKFNRATCHSLLAELVQAGYLYRTNDKSYVLGPAVSRLGAAADRHRSPLQIALPEMRRLADEFEVVCGAVFLEGKDTVVRERVAAASRIDWLLPRGTRLPLRPPFAAGFFFPLSEEAVDRWLDGLSPPPTAKERTLTNAGLAFARENGFQFSVRQQAAVLPQQDSSWLFRDPSDRPVQVGGELIDASNYDLAGMSAPVFDRAGSVEFALSLSGFTGLRTGASIRAIGSRLKDACARISAFGAHQ